MDSLNFNSVETLPNLSTSRHLLPRNFSHRTDGAFEKRGAAEDAHGRPCSLINAIRGQVVDLLNGGSIRMRDLIDVVNHIRCNPDLFPEWHASETAKLFSPPIFENKNENKGYWF